MGGSTFQHILSQLIHNQEIPLTNQNINVSHLESFELHFQKIPLHFSFHISGQEKPQYESIIIRLTDSKGNIGLGESAPFGYLTKDDIPLAHVEMESLLNHFKGKNILFILQNLDRFWTRRELRSVTAVSALQQGLMDLLCKGFGAKLWEAYRAWSVWEKASSPSYPVLGLPTDVTLPLIDPSLVSEFMEMGESLKVPYYKIKVGGNQSEDLDRIEFFMENNVRGVPFSLDGNQGFSASSATHFLEKLNHFGWSPLFFEQPLPENDISGLESLSHQWKTPICVDESVTSVVEAQNLKSRFPLRMINLKHMKSSLLEMIRVARWSYLNGISLMIGGMMESEIGMTHSLHFAYGTGWITWLDLDTPFFLKNFITLENPWNARSAHLEVPHPKGLGLSLDF